MLYIKKEVFNGQIIYCDPQHSKPEAEELK